MNSSSGKQILLLHRIYAKVKIFVPTRFETVLRSRVSFGGSGSWRRWGEEQNLDNNFPLKILVASGAGSGPEAAKKGGSCNVDFKRQYMATEMSAYRYAVPASSCGSGSAWIRIHFSS